MRLALFLLVLFGSLVAGLRILALAQTEQPGMAALSLLLGGGMLVVFALLGGGQNNAPIKIYYRFLTALGGAIVAPVFLIGFIRRNWEDTRTLVLIDIGGLVGLVLCLAFLKPAAPRAAVAQGAAGSVTVVVAAPPQGEAEKALMQRLQQLADPGPGSWANSRSESGKPTTCEGRLARFLATLAVMTRFAS